MRTILPLFAVCLAGILPVFAQTSQLPVFFVEVGKPGADGIRFVAKGSGVTAHFSPSSIQYRVGQGAVRITFPNSNPNPGLIGDGARQGQVNFLVGTPEYWQTNLATYAGITYQNLYPGIDLRYGATARLLKSEFVVAPGAEPSGIRMRYEGAQNIAVLPDCSLAVTISGQQLREEPPVAYQDVNGIKRAVEVRFVVLPDGTVGFRLGDYNPNVALVIDPELSYSTLLGGRGMDTIYAIATDASGNLYVAGRTDSYDLPVVSGAQGSSAGGVDAFVAKLNASGNALVYCTYIGGARDDRAYALAVDTSGSAYVTGTTYSSNFPVRNSLQSRLAGTRNAFVLKLSATGNSLLSSTYLGGNGSDAANAIAVDASGYVYLAGDTTSSNFPATGYQQSNRGLQDGFITKLSADGRQILYSTFLGASAEDHIAAIAVDATGLVTVTGSTYSTDLPASIGQKTSGGGEDAWIARLNSLGTGLIFCSYLGGSSGGVGAPEEGRAVTVDASGNAYVAGVTSSANFPLVRALQTTRRGMTDAFVSVFSAAGVLTYSSYLGGSGSDSANAIVLGSSGDLFIAGETTSVDFPLFNAVQQANAGSYDAFLLRMTTTGDAITYSSYLGGNGSDTVLGLTTDTTGNIYVGGQTLSTDFPFLNGAQSTNPGNFGGFAAKWIFSSSPVPVSVQPASGTGVSQTFRLRFTDLTGAASITTVSILFNSTASTTGGCSVLFSRALNTLTVLTDAGTTPSTAIVPGSSGTVENSQCSLSGIGSTVSIAGTTFTLDLALTFKSAFAGTKNVYLQGNNPHGSSGWQMLGTWTTVAASPTLSSLTLSAAHVYAGTSLSGNLVLLSDLASQDTLVVLASSDPAVIVPATVTVPRGAQAVSFTITTTAVTSSKSATITATLAARTVGSTITVTAGPSLLSLTAPATLANSATATINYALSAAAPAGGLLLALTSSQPQWLSAPSLIAIPAGALSGSFNLTAGQPTTFTPVIITGSAGGRSHSVAISISGPSHNLAAGMPTTQSTTYFGATPDKAVDGDTTGSLWTHTNYGPSPWWQIDLGTSSSVDAIIIYNRTDCCGERLSNYWVFVSDIPFGSSDTPTTLQTRTATWSNHQTVAPASVTSIPVNKFQGRYVRVQLAGNGFLSLAEVQIIGSAVNLNLAQGKASSQSGTYMIGAEADKAIDGNANGHFSTGSVTATAYTASPWWQVDLGTLSTINAVVLTNRTDCCADRLADYWIFVSTVPFAATDTPATLLSRAGTWSAHRTSIPTPVAAVLIPAVQGRYVRVQLAGTGLLSLAEVQVLGIGDATFNVALGRSAAQSTTFAGLDARYAVDGNTSGNLATSLIAHTGFESTPWWQVDLEAIRTVTTVTISNRTDCCGARLGDYWVFLSTVPFTSADTPSTLVSRSSTWSFHQTVAPNPITSITIGSIQARYVRVQLSGTDYLGLAEVQVVGN